MLDTTATPTLPRFGIKSCGVRVRHTKDGFQARNNVVHQGAIPPQALSRVAVGLALATIRFFTSVCLEFKNKNDALHYLDAIGIGDKIKTAHKLKQCIEASVFHSPTGESYPFMKEKRFSPMPWDK